MEIIRRPSTQDITWFLDLARNNQLDLEPHYQRRSVWNLKDRRFFLDTIFREYPSPAIYLHKEITQDGKALYAVVDGKQRLETILRFANNKIAIGNDFGDARLDGKKWREIESDELKRIFWDYVLPVEFINVELGTNFVNEVFDRLNRNVVKLKEQELRHAKYDGWFISFVENQAEKTEWETLRVVTSSKSRRMSDVQFISELLIVQLKGTVGGFDQGEINEFYADYDDPFELEHEFDEEKLLTDFERSKAYLLELEEKHKIIDKYAREVKNLYSLWAVVALNLDLLPSIGDFVENYSLFMEEVNLYKDSDYFEKVRDGEKESSFDGSLKYYQESTGATTEAPQRIARHEVLMKLIFGDSNNDEDSEVD